MDTLSPIPILKMSSMVETTGIVIDNLESLIKDEFLKSENTTEYPPHESDVQFLCTKG